MSTSTLTKICGMPEKGRRRMVVPFVLLVFCGLPAIGQTITGTTDSIQTLIDAAAAGDVIDIAGATNAAGNPDTAATMTYSGPTITITKNITLRGSEDFRPDKIVFSTAADTINIEDNVSVTLENLALTSVNGHAVLANTGSTVKINRCYIMQAGTESLSFAGSTLVVISNSVVFDGEDHGVYFDSASGKLFIGQSTFLNNAGDAVKLQDGTAEVYACLVDGNGGGFNNVGGTFNSHQNRVLNSTPGSDYDSDATPVTQDNEVTADPVYATPPPAWQGDLAAKLLTNDLASLPDEFAAFDGRDFEFDRGVGTPLEVGADQVDAGAALAWLDCDILPNPAGKTVVNIEILLDSLSFYTNDKLIVVVVPQFGEPLFVAPPLITDADGTADLWIKASLDIHSGRRATASILIPDTFGWTTQTVVLAGAARRRPIDGGAQVFLYDIQSSTFYGDIWNGATAINTHDGEVDQDARDGSHFVIDTVAPQLSMCGIYGDRRADSFVTAGNDAFGPPAGAPYAPYYDQWGPDAARNGTAPSSFTEIYFSTQPVPNRTSPKIFFNNPMGTPNNDACSANLSFQVVAQYVDKPPAIEGTSNPTLYYTVDTAGFPTEVDSQDVPLTVIDQDVGRPEALYPLDPTLPRWTTDFSDLVRYIGTDPVDICGTDFNQAKAGVNYTLGAPPFCPTDVGLPTLQVEWSLANINYMNVSGLPFKNDWHIPIAFTAVDATGEVSEFMSPIEAWWMWHAQAEITSNRYNLAPTRDPVFTWDIAAQGDRPGPADPCWPIAKFRLYAAPPNVPDAATALASPWEAVTPWSVWDRRHTIDKASFVQFSPLVTLGEVVETLPNRYLLLCVIGADEAGNVQQITVGSTITNLIDFCILPPDSPLCASDPGEGLCYSQLGRCNGIDFDIWFNEGLESAVETEIEPRFWYNRTDTGNLRLVEPALGEIDFGSSTRIPLVPELGYCAQRIETQFQIHTTYPPNVAAAGVLWRLYEDGRLVAQDDVASGPNLRITIPSDLSVGNVTVAFLNNPPSACPATGDRLGDDGDGPNTLPTAGLNRRRSVEYLFLAQGYVRPLPASNAEVDPTPAAVRFTVYPEGEEFKTEQPIKSFTRE